MKNFKKFSNIRRTGLDQSSPVHPVLESRGGIMSVTDGEGQIEILVSNIGFISFFCKSASPQMVDK